MATRSIHPSLTFAGNGSPDGLVIAPPNSLYFDLDTGLSWTKWKGDDENGWQATTPDASEPAGVVLQASITLTPDQINGLPTTPVVLIEGPGESFYIQLLAATMVYQFGGAAFVTTTEEGDSMVRFGYDTDPITPLGAFLELTGILDQVVDTIASFQGESSGGQQSTRGSVGEITPPRAASLLAGQSVVLGPGEGSVPSTGGDGAAVIINILYALCPVPVPQPA